MKTFALLSLALTAALILPGCKSEVSYNQRLTVVVGTPAGEVRGFAVTQVTKTDTTGGIFLPPEARRVISKVVGEAVVVEVTPGRWLFALLDGREDGLGKAEYLVYPAFALDKALGSDGFRSYEAAMAKLRAQPLDTPGTIPPSDYPLMVTFDDIARPETVRRVDPTDLAASFGPGVALKAVTLEVTEDAVTGGRVEGVLGWLCSQKRDRVRLNGKSGAISDNLLSNNLGSGEFKIGECK